MIKSFSCFKVNEKENDNQPDYRLSAKIGEDYVDIGAGWIKESKNGKYISFKLRDVYREKDGYVIIPEHVPVARTLEEERGNNPPNST